MMIKRIVFLFLYLFSVLLVAQEKPNIVFIEVDDLPTHYTTMQGFTNDYIPTVQKLADEGVYFNNAIVQGTMCGPSRNSFITGVYPHNIGFYENGEFYDIPKGTWTLPSALQRTGYYTAHIGKSHLHPNIDGKKTSESNRIAHKEVLGFDYVWNSLGRSVTSGKEISYGKDMYIDFILDYDKEHGTKYYEKLRSKEDMSTLPDDIYLDGLYTKMALDFINQNKDKTYFLWLNYSVPHGPYDVKKDYHTFTIDDVPTPNFLNDTGVNIPSKLRPHPYNQKELEDTQKGQMANISYMDYQVKRVLQAIDNSGNKEKTIVVFFSDHGILVGDHGLVHKSTLYKEVLNPTLIIFDPRNSTNNKQVISQPVELLDVLKTTMDWANCNTNDKTKPYGESLIPLLNKISGYAKTYAVGECPGYYAIVTKDYKYIAPFYFEDDSDKGEVLFDLNNDPNEKVNACASMPNIISEYRTIAQKWLAKSGKIILQGEEYGNLLGNYKVDNYNSMYKVFPNPVENILNISGNFNNKNNLIQVYSLEGRIIKRLNITKNNSLKVHIDLSSLSSGSYILSINNTNQTIIKK